MFRKKKQSSGASGAPMWLATYSDTMTLLMTFFVLLMTFSTTSPFENLNKDWALVGGKKGTGAVGDGTRRPDRNAIVWRDFSLLKSQSDLKSEAAPNYSDPVVPSSGDALRILEKKPIGKLTDNYDLRLPLNSIFSSNDQLNMTGKLLLKRLAKNLRHLPYEIAVDVDDRGNQRKAYYLCKYLYERGAVHPSRIGIGLRERETPWRNSVWLRFTSKATGA